MTEPFAVAFVTGVTESVVVLTSASFPSRPGAGTCSSVATVVVYESSPATGGSEVMVIVKLRDAAATPPFALPPSSVATTVTAATPNMPAAGV